MKDKEADMPIVIPREKGVPAQASAMTQEQTNLAWEHILRAYLDKHPEVLRTEINTNTAKEHCYV